MLAPMSWATWADRFRKHMTVHGLTQGGIGAVMEPKAKSASTVGNWLSGHNKINLEDFFALCAAAGAKPHLILFGEEMRALAKASLDAFSGLEQPVQDNPRYQQFETRLRKSKPPAAPKRRRKSKISAERRVKPRRPPRGDRPGDPAPAGGDD